MKGRVIPWQTRTARHAEATEARGQRAHAATVRERSRPVATAAVRVRSVLPSSVVRPAGARESRVS